MVDVCLLGSGGMMPLADRWLTAMLLRHEGRLILVDCGEGTQIPFRQAGWGFRALDAILLTHYHADHTAGLPGLLLTVANSGRTEPLALYGPPGLRLLARALDGFIPELPFPLIGTELPMDAPSSFPVGDVTVGSLPADHRVPCLSYRFDVRRAGRFDPARAKELGVPLPLWKRLQNGETVAVGKWLVSPDRVVGPERRGIRVGYYTDTRPTPALPGFMKECDLLIGEGLYADDSLAEKARERGHMIFSQSAQIAAQSGSRELWLTHFSPSLTDPEAALPAVRQLFPRTEAGRSGLKRSIAFGEQGSELPRQGNR